MKNFSPLCYELTRLLCILEVEEKLEMEKRAEAIISSNKLIHCIKIAMSCNY